MTNLLVAAFFARKKILHC